MAQTATARSERRSARIRGTVTGASRRSSAPALYEALLEAQDDLDQIVIFARGGRALFWNAALARVTGYSNDELAALPTLLALVALEERDPLAERLRRERAGARLATRVVRKDGEVRDVEFSFRRDRAGHVVIVGRDITERARAQQALERQTLYDALTELPNRTLFLDRLEQALLTTRRQGSGMGLVVMDLDNFREVNDTAGHHVGDALLVEVARRLRSRLRDTDTIARLGGDEFGLVLPSADAAGAVLVARKVLQALERPFVIERRALDISASLGIALSPEHGEGRDDLLRRADVAMYAAKRDGSGFSVYASEQDQHSPRRLALAGELRGAIAGDELVLHYHPLVSLRTGKVRWMEALVRWQHPTRGLLAPGEFVPLAERSGLMKPLTEWVVRAALAQCAAWQRASLELRIAVNLSMRNLLDPELAERIAALVGEAGVPALRLGLEITENVLMADPDRVLRTLVELRGMGCRIAIDDFGTGYSSLAYLHRLPVDEVKIDRSFVTPLRSDRSSLVIVRATIDLAHSLGCEVVAEGVEDQESLEILKALGCDTAQGFFLGKPMPASEVEAWLAGRAEARTA